MTIKTRSSFSAYLLQIHLVRTIPGFEKLAGALLLQRYHDNIITPAKYKVLFKYKLFWTGWSQWNKQHSKKSHGNGSFSVCLY